MKYEIIDNFLPQEAHANLEKALFSAQFPYYWTGVINPACSEEDTTSYFGHEIYNKNLPNPLTKEPWKSFHYNVFLPIINNLPDLKRLIRAKVNAFKATPTIENYGFHQDQVFKCKGLVYYVNTCNGGTILQEGNKLIESVANRALMFDPYNFHASTSCTDKKLRMVVNVNYE